MSRNQIFIHLKNIQEAAISACHFIEGMTFDNFLDDERTQKAVSMNFVIIGENANKICEKFSDFIPEKLDLPWMEIRGLRNRIVHAYPSINWNYVWLTIQKDLPALIDAIASYLNNNSE